ncbi:phosphoribosylaminoimidazole-succinocarboxamide synthase [Rhizobium mesoamericanum]|nr:phosphoribosylaminoimidazole-succinocarboxamide synthase [Rhizobium mesoamericanum]
MTGASGTFVAARYPAGGGLDKRGTVVLADRISRPGGHRFGCTAQERSERHDRHDRNENSKVWAS